PLEQWEAARAISQELGGLPLALDQAGAYIASQGCTPVEYLAVYRNAGRERHVFAVPDRAGEQDVVAVTRLVIGQVEAANGVAVDLLRLCAFLAPEAIPDAIFSAGVPALGERLGPVAADELALEAAIRAAAQHSLLQRDRATHTLTMHRVIQKVVRDELSKTERGEWAERAV